MNRINLLNFWTTLATRSVAKDILKIAEKNSFNVEFDFSGVKIMNSSFADELFAKAIVEWKRFKIVNIENEFIKQIIVFVTEARRNKKEKQIY